MKLSEKFFVGALGGIIGAVITILITSTTPLTAKDKPVDATFNAITCKEINVIRPDGWPAVTIYGSDINGGLLYVYDKEMMDVDPEAHFMGNPAIHLGYGRIICKNINVVDGDGRPTVEIKGGGDYSKYGYVLVHGQDSDHGDVLMAGGWTDKLSDNTKNEAMLSAGSVYSKNFIRTRAR